MTIYIHKVPCLSVHLCVRPLRAKRAKLSPLQVLESWARRALKFQLNILMLTLLSYQIIFQNCGLIFWVFTIDQPNIGQMIRSRLFLNSMLNGQQKNVQPLLLGLLGHREIEDQKVGRDLVDTLSHHLDIVFSYLFQNNWCQLVKKITKLWQFFRATYVSLKIRILVILDRVTIFNIGPMAPSRPFGVLCDEKLEGRGESPPLPC